MSTHSLAVGHSANEPKVQLSERITDSDYRVLTTLGIGGATSLIGMALMIKSFWSSRTAEEFDNATFFDKLREDCKQTGQLFSGLMLTGLGVLLIANSKNLPASFDAIAEQNINQCCK